MKWISVEDRLPDEGKAVLVQHTDDLYPVVAYRILEDPSLTYWLYESDGPEDDMRFQSFRHQALLRPPTHWMPLPEPPENDNEDSASGNP